MADNKDVFGIDSRIGGAWTLDGAVIDIEGGELLVVTSIDITYRRQSQKFSPLNQSQKYLAIGEADGMLQMGMVIGPHAAIKDFLKTYSDVCLIKENNLRVSPSGMRYTTSRDNCKEKGVQLYFLANGCIINSLRISIKQSGGALTVVNAGIDMQFISLSVGPNE
jgi:hypothetical protein